MSCFLLEVCLPRWAGEVRTPECLIQYCAAEAEIWEAWDDDDVSTAAKTSCTSRLHQWGIPKRRLIEPDLPVDEI